MSSTPCRYDCRASCRLGVEGALEIVDDRQQVAQHELGGALDRLEPLALDALAIVVELGRQSGAAGRAVRRAPSIAVRSRAPAASARRDLAAVVLGASDRSLEYPRRSSASAAAAACSGSIVAERVADRRAPRFRRALMAREYRMRVGPMTPTLPPRLPSRYDAVTRLKGFRSGSECSAPMMTARPGASRYSVSRRTSRCFSSIISTSARSVSSDISPCCCCASAMSEAVPSTNSACWPMRAERGAFGHLEGLRHQLVVESARFVEPRDDRRAHFVDERQPENSRLTYSAARLQVVGA